MGRARLLPLRRRKRMLHRRGLPPSHQHRCGRLRAARNVPRGILGYGLRRGVRRARRARRLPAARALRHGPGRVHRRRRGPRRPSRLDARGPIRTRGRRGARRRADLDEWGGVRGDGAFPRRVRARELHLGGLRGVLPHGRRERVLPPATPLPHGGERHRDRALLGGDRVPCAGVGRRAPVERVRRPERAHACAALLLLRVGRAGEWHQRAGDGLAVPRACEPPAGVHRRQPRPDAL
mmetsp:Transcript_68356/g.163148  ORF Transcript_68356/g.163148 Transcript_68356/m.163148 type:complete len:237 (+) Transcript_68356:428-1138(+)